MNNNIKMVAVDMDGTFVRSDYTYDVPRFKQILSRMKSAGCNFVVASGNQYYQLRDLFPGDYDELSFVAENGAFVKDRKELVFTANMPKETVDFVIDICREYPEIKNVVCGVNSAYCESGTVSQEFFERTNIYYHRLLYYDMFRERLNGKAEPTTSGHGAIDLIVPGCHKASGLKRLTERWGISPEQCVAFGDGGNDIEMLNYCGCSYAMENAPQNVKNAARYVCPSNEEDGVLVTLEKIFGEG